MNKYLGIDPGNIQSAYVIVDESLKPIEFGKVFNEELLDKLYEIKHDMDFIAIEMIGHYGKGMPAGKTVFDTCIWIGRFLEAVKDIDYVKFIMRSEEKISLCGTMKAKDSNIRQALIDRFAQFDFKNGKGTKNNRDWFYGFKADVWQAYAVIVTAHELYIKKLGGSYD